MLTRRKAVLNNHPGLVPLDSSAKVYAASSKWLYHIDKNCLTLQKGVFEELGYLGINQEEAVQRQLRPCPFCACVPLPPDPLRVRVFSALKWAGRQLAHAAIIVAAIGLIAFIGSKINADFAALNFFKIVTPFMVVAYLVVTNLPIKSH